MSQRLITNKRRARNGNVRCCWGNFCKWKHLLFRETPFLSLFFNVFFLCCFSPISLAVPQDRLEHPTNYRQWLVGSIDILIQPISSFIQRCRKCSVIRPIVRRLLETLAVPDSMNEMKSSLVIVYLELLERIVYLIQPTDSSLSPQVDWRLYEQRQCLTARNRLLDDVILFALLFISFQLYPFDMRHVSIGYLHGGHVRLRADGRSWDASVATGDADDWYTDSTGPKYVWLKWISRIELPGTIALASKPNLKATHIEIRASS